MENHTCAAAPREKDTAEQDFLLVREAYEKATGNRWNRSDSEAYEQNKIGNVPLAKIISVCLFKKICGYIPAQVTLQVYDRA